MEWFWNLQASQLPRCLWVTVGPSYMPFNLCKFKPFVICRMKHSVLVPVVYLLTSLECTLEWVVSWSWGSAVPMDNLCVWGSTPTEHLAILKWFCWYRLIVFMKMTPKCRPITISDAQPPTPQRAVSSNKDDETSHEGHPESYHNVIWGVI